jgi:hypothetical protein
LVIQTLDPDPEPVIPFFFRCKGKFAYVAQKKPRIKIMETAASEQKTLWHGRAKARFPVSQLVSRQTSPDTRDIS